MNLNNNEINLKNSDKCVVLVDIWICVVSNNSKAP